MNQYITTRKYYIKLSLAKKQKELKKINFHGKKKQVEKDNSEEENNSEEKGQNRNVDSENNDEN